MTKSQAKAQLDEILAPLNARPESVSGEIRFVDFLHSVYFPFYERKWRRSTAATNANRIEVHLISSFAERELKKFNRDELQDVLDRKAAEGLSFSVVDHLRWDLKQIFDMAIAEGWAHRNPAVLLFTPRNAPRPTRSVMTIEEVRKCFLILEARERLIVKLATLVGLRPGEIFGLKWGQVREDHLEIRQRVYRGEIDTPKTASSVRNAALPGGVSAELRAWRMLSLLDNEESWIFPSETLKTPMSKDNCWRRHIAPRLVEAGIGWVNFQVMRRTHSSLMKKQGADPKLVADQLGHSLDVNQNVYTQVGVARRKEAVEQLESMLVN